MNLMYGFYVTLFNIYLLYKLPVFFFSSPSKDFSWDDSLECNPEVNIEDGVDDGVQSGVDIAQPSNKAHHLELKTNKT